MGGKYNGSQKRAIQKYDANNKEKRQYINKRSAAKSFILNLATYNDLMNLKEYLLNREKEINIKKRGIQMNEWLDRFTSDYLDDILVRLAHHSTAIEGNTISLPETVSIILHNTLPSSSGASVREFYEIDNHRQAFEFMMEMLQQDEPLSVALIQEMHSKLTDRLQYDRGQFKKNDNRIVGAEFKTALPAETPGLMIQLVDNLNYRLEVANDDEKIEAIVDYHIQFERIHPFSDGNGRTGRMIMNYSLLKEKLPPFIVHKSDRGVYIERLANQDVEGLKKMALEEMNQERERMIDFGHTKENEITEIEQELE